LGVKDIEYGHAEYMCFIRNK